MKKILKVLTVLFLVFALALFIAQRHMSSVIKKIAVPLVKKQLSLVIDFDRADVNLFIGRVQLTGFSLLKGDGDILFKADRIVADLSFSSFFGEEILIRSLKLDGIELDLKTGEDIANTGEYKSLVGNIDCKKTSSSSCLFIDEISIKGGKINFYDGHISRPPHLTVFDDIKFNIREIGTGEKDKGNYSDFSIECVINPEDGGACGAKGRILLWSDKHNFDAELKIKRLDLTRLKPYYGKRMSLSLSEGYMSLTSSIRCRNDIIEAENTAVFENIGVAKTADLNSLVFGFPAQTFIEFLKTEKGSFEVKFTVSGDINNPRFNVESQFMDAISVSISSVIKNSLKMVQNVTEKAAKMGTKASETAVNVGKSAAETTVDTTKAVEKSVTDTLKSLIPGGNK
ncbi:MAG: DUF748 domain-containing protein [Candidatus Aureabacteria bacterium]|nr:DUF748 domain-containing protein [Candidatus Auribacterota bacterium]